jgi:competence protein ComEC
MSPPAEVCAAAPRATAGSQSVSAWLGPPTAEIIAVLRGAPVLVCAALGWLLGDAVGYARVPAALLSALAAVGCLAFAGPDPAYRRVAIAVCAFVFSCIAAADVYRPVFSPEDVARAPMHVPVQIEGVLTADPELGDGRVRFWVAVDRLEAGGGWRAAEGQIVLSVREMEREWRSGDRLRAEVSLRRPRNFGNPGEFDIEAYWARRNIYVTAYADDDAEFNQVGHVDNLFADWLSRWRRGVGALFRSTLSEPQAGVLSALIVGTDGALPRELRQAFTRAGVSHVLSISGLHLALVAAAGYALIRWLLARSRRLLLGTNVPKLAVGLSVIPVLLYAGIAGSNVATTRSVLMILVFMGATVVDRQRHMVISLAVAAIGILLYAPGAALDISFQLSFVSVLGLVLAMERFWPWWTAWEERHLVRLRGWRARLWRPIAAYIAVAVGALAATTPLTAWHFNQVSFAAPLANAVVVPLLGSGAVILGLLAASAYAFSAPLAQLFVLCAGPCVQLGVWFVRLFAGFPYAAVRVATPTLLELALLYGGWLSVLTLRGHRRAIAAGALVSLLAADGTWWYAARYHHSDLRVSFLSVGQGDCAVAELPGGTVMVIDGGGLGGDGFDVGERVVAPFLWSRKIAHVDYLVLSHHDWDHYGGLAFLAAQFSPHEFWWNGSAARSERFAHLQQTLTENAVQRITAGSGTQRNIGAVAVRVLSPVHNPNEIKANNASVVLRLAFAGRSVLFPGDIEAAAERDLVANADGNLRSPILKVPHHGSHTSSTARFLDAVAPQLAVISDGFQNRFGFPHRDVLARYASRGSMVARTDLDGAVQVQIQADGRIAAQTYREEPSLRAFK